MNILHIASIAGNTCNGVHVAVPQHIQAQQRLVNVGIVNTRNVPVDGAEKQFPYDTPFEITNLPAPFDSPDLVVFHEVYKKEYLSISANLRKMRIPYVILPHGSLTAMAQRKSWAKKIVGNLLLFNRFINNAKGIQFLSQNELNKSRNKQKGFVGTNGMNLPDVLKTKFHDDKVNFVFIGRKDIYYKGLDLLLPAIASNNEGLRMKNARIQLYGPGHAKNLSTLDEMVRDLCVNDLVQCYGGIQGEQKREVLLSADVFIQTSRSEGMPMGILEALSYGVPCLVTEGTSMGELIRRYDAGWVVQTDTQDIGCGLNTVISQRDQWQIKSRNARKMVEENFLWDKVVLDAINNYRRIIEQG